MRKPLTPPEQHEQGRIYNAAYYIAHREQIKRRRAANREELRIAAVHRERRRIAAVIYAVPPETRAWVAGIYEGEGSIGSRGRVSVTQKDPWILYRLQSLYGGRVTQYDPPYHRWNVSGETARMFMLSIWDWLSPRRREQALPALQIRPTRHLGKNSPLSSDIHRIAADAPPAPC